MRGVDRSEALLFEASPPQPGRGRDASKRRAFRVLVAFSVSWFPPFGLWIKVLFPSRWAFSLVYGGGGGGDACK